MNNKELKDFLFHSMDDSTYGIDGILAALCALVFVPCLGLACFICYLKGDISQRGGLRRCLVDFIRTAREMPPPDIHDIINIMYILGGVGLVLTPLVVIVISLFL